MEHVRYGRGVPCLSPPVDIDTVSLMQSLVGAFGLVCRVMPFGAREAGVERPFRL